MKNATLLLVLLTGVVGASPQMPRTNPVNPQKKALIVAVGDYPAESGWQKINAGNDVPLIREVLTRQGFAAGNMTVLQDRQAVKSTIVKAFEALTESVRPGDILFIHFSGHGQQIYDDDGDEFDGFDEAIVPFDAPKTYHAQGYKGQNHLRDDELGRLLAALSAKAGAGGSVLVTLDACHSGSGTRANQEVVVRGTRQPLAPPGYRPARSTTAKEPEWLGQSLPGKPGSAPVVVISATGPDQLNYEFRNETGQRVGPLTYALAKVLSGSKAIVSCGAFFDEMRVILRGIAPNQTPGMEGAADREVFSGKLVRHTPYFVPEFEDTDQLRIPAGQLLHVYPGTVVALYPIGTLDPGTPGAGPPVATGKVTESTFSSATVVPDRPLSRGEVARSWVFIREQHFGPMHLTVKIDLPQKPALAAALTTAIRGLKNVKLTGEGTADLLIDDVVATSGSKRGPEVVLRKHDKEMYRAPFAEASPEMQAGEITDRIASAARASYLLNHLVLQNKSMRVEAALIPVAVDADKRFVSTLDASAFLHKGTLQLREEDWVMLRVSNKGSQRVFFTVIDIQPDDQINVVVPYPQSEPGDFSLGAGETRVIKGFPLTPLLVSPPYGDEVFKVIATRQPVDLRRVLQGHDTRSPEALHPLEALLGNASSQRGRVSGASPPDAAYVETILFRIVPRQ